MVKKPIIISLAILIILPVVSLLGGQQVFAAATITVNSNLDTVADDGACTLREAITSANSDTASGVSVLLVLDLTQSLFLSGQVW